MMVWEWELVRKRLELAAMWIDGINEARQTTSGNSDNNSGHRKENQNDPERIITALPPDP